MTTLNKVIEESLNGKTCKRCSMPLNEVPTKRWEKPLCAVGGTEYDTHVIGISDLRTTISKFLSTIEEAKGCVPEEMVVTTEEKDGVRGHSSYIGHNDCRSLMLENLDKMKYSNGRRYHQKKR